MSTNPGTRPHLGGRYRLDTVIGRGGMGQVWQGWDERLERAVAVKVMHGPADDRTTAARFDLEARTAAQLHDPHVVAVYDFGTEQQYCYLVMELVAGRSLAQVLDHAGAIDPVRAVALAAEIAQGLATAHAHAVVHRDIKPANLLLDEEDHVHIADFGVARFTEDTTTAPALTGDGRIVGTVAYLAAECALGRPATAASDIYALGCVLYQLLTGRPPFHADVPAATLYQHVHTDPAAPHRLRPGVPTDLSAFVLELMAKDPSRRPTAGQAADWLGRWSPRAVAERRTRRPVLLVGAAAVAVAASTAGILGMTHHPGGTRPPAPAPTGVAGPTHPGTTAPAPRRSSASASPVSGPAASAAAAVASGHGGQAAEQPENTHQAKKPKKPKKPKK